MEEEEEEGEGLQLARGPVPVEKGSNSNGQREEEGVEMATFPEARNSPSVIVEKEGGDAGVEAGGSSFTAELGSMDGPVGDSSTETDDADGSRHAEKSIGTALAAPLY